jgi:hypothetical protein
MAAPFSLANLVHQTATTTGTGNFTLAAVSGKQTLDAAYGHGATTDVFEYFISSQAQAEWEHGSGHMSDATTLARDTIWDGSNGTSAVNFSAGTKDVTSALGALGLWAPRGSIDGLTLSNDGTTPNTKIDVAAGLCRDDTDAMCIRLAASKAIDCGTTGANGLDTGSLANSTWYHVFAIGKRDGSAQAALASTSASAPTLPSGYQYQRRIGSFKTDGSAHIVAFTQNGDEFLWLTAVGDISTTTLGTTATLFTLTVPLGVKVNALLRGATANASVNICTLINSPDENSVVPNAVAGNFTQIVSAANQLTGFNINVRTNTSQQVRAVSTAASTSLYGAVYGWIDPRGKNK